MNNTTVTLAIVFMPIVFFLFGFGIYKHTEILSLNSAIDKQHESLGPVSASVNKCIIREKTFHISGSGSSSSGRTIYTYEVYVDVNYEINGNNIHSFGKYAEFPKIEGALSFYESLPERPPLYYQQLSDEKNSIREAVFTTLNNFKSKQIHSTKPLTIMYSKDDLSVNQLLIKDKKKTGGIYVSYGIGLLMAFLYFVFCYLAKTGKESVIPVYITFGLLFVVLFIRFLTVHETYKRGPLSEPALEMRINN
jgi:hypothetical protein